MNPGKLPSGDPSTVGAGHAAMQLTVAPPQLAQGALQRPRVGDVRSGGEGCQVPDTSVDADHARAAVPSRDVALDLDGEGDVPAVGGAGDGGGQDAGAAVLQPSGELAGRLVGLKYADLGQPNVLAVVQHLDPAGGEPAGVPGSPLPLLVWKPHRAPLTTAMLRVSPVLERSGEPVQAGGVGFLAVLGPPGSDLILGAVPVPAEGRQGPGHLDVLAGPTLLQAGLDQSQPPVVGVAVLSCGARRSTGTNAARARDTVDTAPFQPIRTTAMTCAGSTVA